VLWVDYDAPIVFHILNFIKYCVIFRVPDVIFYYVLENSKRSYAHTIYIHVTSFVTSISTIIMQL